MQNGIMVNLDFDDLISDDEIIAWKSSQNWVYLSLLNTQAPINKEYKRKFKGAIKQIVIDAFDESIQLAFLIKNPILGIDIINSKSIPSAVIFIHTEMKSSEVARLKNHISKSGTTIFSVAESKSFPKYNTSFKAAFNQARIELGSNSIFDFKGKLYTTNHPWEKMKKKGPEIFEESMVVNINEESDAMALADSIVNSQPLMIEEINKDSIPTNLFDSFAEELTITPISSIEPHVQIDTSSIKPIMFSWMSDNFPKNQILIPDRFIETDSVFINDIKPTLFDLDAEITWPDDTHENVFYYEGDYWEDSLYLFYLTSEIYVKTEKPNIPIYIDGKFVGDTPLNGPIRVNAGWHQVSKESPYLTHLSSYYETKHGLKSQDNLYGAMTVYVQPGITEIVTFNSGEVRSKSKRPKQKSGGMMIGTPIIFFIMGFISWGLG
jgi:hypothetical protein